MPALGDEFRSAREARGLSLSDVAERLHIRSVYLAAIEDEDWKAIGAPVYVRGFMRTYARFLGLDAEAAVGRFSALVPPATPAGRPSAATEERAAGERRGLSFGAILAIAVALVAVVFVGYEFYEYHASLPAGPTEAAATAAPVADASAGPAASSAPTALALPSPAAALVPTPVAAKPVASKHGLSLKFTETSWVRVTVDGNVVLEGTYPPGTAKSFHGSTADVRVGNAGGVQLAVDGRPIGPLGHDGDVVERQFTLSGE